MRSRKNNPLKLVIKSIVVVLIVAAAVFVVLDRQALLDQINYWTYHPSSEIASYVTETTMTSEGKFLFYSAHPALENQTSFNKSCPSYSSDTAILGCYDGQNIYIYDVTNSELDGIKPETAAYEMLHAAYKRLSPSDRATVDRLVEAEYAKQATSETNDAVAYFAKYEPGQRDDELFSVVATQFSDISPQLETYYAHYFSNRQALVSLYNQYQGVFNSLKNQSDALYNQLNTLMNTITIESKQYASDSASLSADISAFNSKASSGGFTSQSNFDTTRAALVARSSALDAERTHLNADITTYNSEVNEYNQLAIQTQALQNSINSEVAPAPSL